MFERKVWISISKRQTLVQNPPKRVLKLSNQSQWVVYTITTPKVQIIQLTNFESNTHDFWNELQCESLHEFPM